MNSQTPGPIKLDFSEYHGCHTLLGSLTPNSSRYVGSVQVYQTPRAMGVADEPERKANAELLAAAYSAFDRAGRDLGVDATELARSIYLPNLIYAAILATSPTVGGASPQSIARANAETYCAASRALKPLGKIVEKIELPRF